jgi:hypothetical protein
MSNELNNEPLPGETQPTGLNPARALMSLFDKLSLRERIAKIRFGLKQPKDSGDYKWAVVECQRFASPVAAIVVPTLAVIMLVVFGAMSGPASRSVAVQIKETEAPPPLDEIKPIEEVQQDLPDPVEVDFTQNVVSDVPSPTPPTDFSPQPATVDAVAITKSPVILRGVFAGRNPGSIGAALASNGASFTDVAVMRALRWLKMQQSTDGSWPQTKPAMTSLAILTYLAHGDTPASEEFGVTVERALRFLVASQEANGRFTGRDGNDYTQPIGAYALSEAYGMTKVPELKYAAEKAIAVVIKGQNAVGGFNYNLVGPSDTRNDTTYTSWCVQALKAAKVAGLSNEGLDACMTKAIDGVRKNYGERDGYGGFGYTEPGGGGTGLSGAGVLCLQFLGDTKSKEFNGGIAGLSNATFDWAKPFGGSPLYFWYYITQARFQYGGDSWNVWNKLFSPTLVKNQQVIDKDKSGYVDHKNVPHAIGFWDSPSKSEHTGGNGRVMDTMLCTLMLEVYYRYLPTFKTDGQATEKVDLNKASGNINVSIRGI